MRARSENGRQEEQVCPRSLGGPNLWQVVHRRAPDSVSRHVAHSPMRSVAAQKLGAGDEQEVPFPGSAAFHLLEELPPLSRRKAIVTENDPGTLGEPRQCVPDFISLPLVGHQPGSRQRLAAAHGRSYSSRMEGASPAERLAAVRAEIARAAALARRSPDAAKLIAVSKTHPAEAIRPLIEAGQRAFGENRVQEAEAKWPDLLKAFPDIELHLIGRLQSNKAEEAVGLFHFIHSVDRPSLVAALAKAMDRSGRRPGCFVQVNVGEEAQKGGCLPAGLPDLLDQCSAADLPVVGLMCIPPADVEPAPYFALLAKLARRHDVSGLSMGMSSDYATAVMLGATHVRVGTALFGERS
jgi:pyridoxal phosphate enzyme (YggS family)